MEALSLLMMILVSLWAYSAGAGARAGRRSDPRPSLADLAVMTLVWAGGILARFRLPWNTWLVTLGWAVPAYLSGRLSRLAQLKKESPGRGAPETAVPADMPERGVKKLGRKWRDFSRRAGAFQARLILSFVFLLAAAPFGLIAKIKDPLRLRKGLQDSYWIPRAEQDDDLERSRRQF
ncbi:MAG: hypothetical protein WBC70_01445 [Candidatus Aminicenantales bacterium]